MFAYCNNNPVMGYDPCGTCIHNWKFYNCENCEAFWNGVGQWFEDKYNKINSVYQQQTQLQTQITMQQNEMLADAAAATWDAYVQGYNMHQEAQIKEAQMMTETVMHTYHFIETHDKFAQGLSGTGKVAKGAIGIGYGVGLLVAPIPTAADDLLGVSKITFGIYNVCYGIAEIVGALLR